MQLKLAKCFFIVVSLFARVGFTYAQKHAALQQKYLYVFDDETKQTYRIKFNHTKILVRAHVTDTEKFKDRITAMDSNGIYFAVNGFYSFKQIDFIRFRPFYAIRSIFQRVYYIAVLNGTFYFLFSISNDYGNGALIGQIWLTAAPLWAFMVPQGINLLMLIATPNVVISGNHAKFMTGGSRPPIRPGDEKLR